MADPELYTFRNQAGEELVIDKKDLVAVIPDEGADSTTSTVVYVEHDVTDNTAPPKISINPSSSTSDAGSRPTQSNTDEVHIIISIGSGKREAEAFYHGAVKPILAAFEPRGLHDYSVHVTESETTILELTNSIFFPRADAGKALRLILLSGDGGIVDLVNGLSAKPTSSTYKAPQVVILPLGTANALYHSSNAGKDNTWGLRALTAGTSKPLPIFTASFSSGARLLIDEARKEEELSKDPETGNPILHGAVVCSWGMHASLVADSDTTEYRKFGIDRFKMAAKEALYPADGSPPHAYKAKVSVLRGDIWKDLDASEHMYVLATMVSNLEKPFTISPASKPLDGSLHLVQFGPCNGEEAMRLMGLAYQGGKHVEDPSVLYEAIDGLRIQFEGKEEHPRWRRICVDGKIVRVEEHGWVELRKEHKRVLEVVSM